MTGEELRNARLAAGLTQAQLAVRADCSLGSLGNMEAGAIPRRSAVLERVQAILDPYTHETRDSAIPGFAKHGDAPPHAEPT
ncbi:MAG: helix-turn-helix domain-containing protein [Thermoleophilaceae bacterium]